MAIIKCKMCGGDLELLEDSSVCECEYCGTKQTVPKVDDEKKLKLFERANRLRAACEFDKAAGVYETIIADFDQEAEAYWGLILCKFGIEYVDDPATGKKIPTCHRSSFESLMDDPNFEMVMECADPIARRVYRDEAKQIEELRKRIIEVSSKEEPYDVFISYKELAEDGQRTLDSVIAQDIYTELTDKGYRVFFSRISLEDKLGVEYEPYIFAALNSAKVMLVVGTDYDYFNAVWVKNEWSRFLALMAKGEKKVLIPVFKGIDAYDMPKEFNKLAAQDMGKVGAMQDLVRGVEKILGKKQEEPAPAQPQQVIVQQGGGPNVQALLKRGNQCLEDGDWKKATDFFDQVLSMDAENADAFLGLAMAEGHVRDAEQYVEELYSQTPSPKDMVISFDAQKNTALLSRYEVPKRLTRADLLSVFNFRVVYGVTAESQRALADAAMARLQENRNLSRAFRYARGESQQRLEALRRRLEEQFAERIRAAEEADKEAESKAQAEFAEKHEQAIALAEKKKQRALADIEAVYLDACRLKDDATSSQGLRTASQLFASLGDYKNSVKLKQEADTLSEVFAVDKEIKNYQQTCNFLEAEMKHSFVKRRELKRDLAWYQAKIEELEQKKAKIAAK